MKPSAFSGRNRSPYVAELGYSYSVAGGLEAGWYRREFATYPDAREFIRDLKGKPVAVNYHPNNPARSSLSQSSLDFLLANRAPAPAAEYFPVDDSVPDWIRPVLWVFAWISAIGLVVSLWVHLGAVLGKRVAPESFFWILHIGIFVVWLPAVFTSASIAKNVRPKDVWKVVLKGSTPWMRYMVYVFFAYAIVNFLLFMTQVPQVSSVRNPPAIVWRGFSGHWMVFYSAAFAILYSAAHRKQCGWRCSNGHAVASNARYCERCGQPVMPALHG